MFEGRWCTFYAKWIIWIVVTVFIMTIFIYPQKSEAETLDGIDVTAADQQTEEVLEELEGSGGAVLFASEQNVLTNKTAAKDKVVLSYSRIIHYENFFTRNFRVKYDGKTMVAYCVQPKVQPPAEGSWTATEYNNKLMTKALYYSYGYPGYDKKTRTYISKRDIDDDYEGDDGAYVLSHLVLSYFYDKQSINSDAFLGVSSDTKRLVIKIADLIENTWPAVPDDSSLSLNKKSVKAVWDKELQKQKTPVFELKGHEDNKIKVTIPKYTTMVKTADGVTKKYYRGEDNSVKVRVYGGDSFYFTASEDVRGTFKSPEMKGSLTDFQPYLIKIQGKQDIIYCGTGETDSVSFEIKWSDVGRFELNKVSANEEITSGNGCYTLEGAEYHIYDSDGKVYETVTTGSDGKGYVKLPYGNYTFKEVKASGGYSLDDTTYKLVVDAESAKSSVKENPQVDAPPVLLQKKDSENVDEDGAQFGASLKNAEYVVKFYGGYYDENTDFSKLEPLREWTFKTDSEGKIKLIKDYFASGDELYFDKNGNVVLPMGTVTIQEVKAPRGYLLNEKVFIRQISPDKKGHYEIILHLEQIIRGDICFVKQAEGQEGFLEGISFRITSKSTGESCQIITDKNGIATTEKSDVWIGEENADKDGKGALPYDSYVIDEIRNDKNFGLQLLENIEVVIDQNNTTVDLGILIDKKIHIETTAADKNNGKKNILSGKVTEIRDTVSYQGLEKGETYVLKGLLIDKENGKIIENNGNDVIGKTEFKASDVNGKVNVDFCFDSRGLENHELVVYEYLYEKGELIASHEDIDSVTQTVTINSETSPLTGDHIPLLVVLLFVILSLFGIAAVFRRE